MAVLLATVVVLFMPDKWPLLPLTVFVSVALLLAVDLWWHGMKSAYATLLGRTGMLFVMLACLVMIAAAVFRLLRPPVF